jgi:hypothetical protein
MINMKKYYANITLYDETMVYSIGGDIEKKKDLIKCLDDFAKEKNYCIDKGKFYQKEKEKGYYEIFTREIL